ncbi:MAG: hypothetical protein ACXVMS_12070 [Flavisolibacter sp.]
MRYFILICFPLLVASCEAASFEGDKRQIAAKNAVRAQLPPGARFFDIGGFREDTLSTPDSTFKRPIQYSLDFVYTDSTGTVRQQTARVLFAPDGRSLVETAITDRKP